MTNITEKCLHVLIIHLNDYYIHGPTGFPFRFSTTRVTFTRRTQVVTLHKTQTILTMLILKTHPIRCLFILGAIFLRLLIHILMSMRACVCVCVPPRRLNQPAVYCTTIFPFSTADGIVAHLDLLYSLIFGCRFF